MTRIVQQPESPDATARRAGIDIYGTTVGQLRRRELWRLGNAWGANFPPGCTKNHMLPFFKELEARGIDPFEKKNLAPERPSHSGESHAEGFDEKKFEGMQEQKKPAPEPDAPKTEDPELALRARLEALEFGQLKKIVKDSDLKQSNTDTRDDLVNMLLEKEGY